MNRIKSNRQTGLLGINVGPNKDTHDRIEDYVKCLNIFHDVADYITINVSSPNTENLRNLHNQPKMKHVGAFLSTLHARVLGYQSNAVNQQA